MRSKSNAAMAFKFTVPCERNNTVYAYKPTETGVFARQTGIVTGGTIRDPILYSVERVNEALSDGTWVVVEEKQEFPRAGIYAKCMTKKVFVVGKTPKGQWVVYNHNGEISVDPFCLEELSEADERIFSVMVDLDLDYHRAERLILKGYVKQ